MYLVDLRCVIAMFQRDGGEITNCPPGKVPPIAHCPGPMPPIPELYIVKCQEKSRLVLINQVKAVPVIIMHYFRALS